MMDMMDRSGSTRARPRPAVTHGLGLLLLLVLAGCNLASPSSSPSSQGPTVTIVPVAGSVAVGDPLQFQVRAEPAPQEDLTVSVAIVSPDCELPQSQESVTITAGASAATLRVPTAGVEVGEDGCEVTTALDPGEGYVVGSGDTVGSSRSASAVITPIAQTQETVGDPETIIDPAPVPEVTISRIEPGHVDEGATLRFRLTATPPPEADLTVNLQWRHLAARFLSGPPLNTVTIPTSGTAEFEVATDDDDFDDHPPLGAAEVTVYVTVEAGSGYRVGSRNSALWGVRDDDEYLVTVAAVSSPVEEGDPVSFRFTVTPAAPYPLTIALSWSVEHGGGGSPMEKGADDLPTTFTIATGVTSATIAEATVDDDESQGFYSSRLVSLRVVYSTGYTLGSPYTARVFVDDDDNE